MYKPIAFSVTICKKYLVELENDEKEGRENEAAEDSADSIAPPLKTEGSQEKLTKDFWRSGGGEGRSGGGADYGRLSRCARCRRKKSSKARINCSRRWCQKPVLKPYIFW